MFILDMTLFITSIGHGEPAMIPNNNHYNKLYNVTCMLYLSLDVLSMADTDLCRVKINHIG